MIKSSGFFLGGEENLIVTESGHGQIENKNLYVIVVNENGGFTRISNCWFSLSRNEKIKSKLLNKNSHEFDDFIGD